MQLPDPQNHPSAEALLKAIDDYIEVAEGSLATQNMVELSGMDAVVDVLCARILKLDKEEGRAFVDQLGDLHDRLGRLQELMRDTKEKMETELHELNVRQRASRAYRKED